MAEFVGTFILVFTVFGVIHRKAAVGFAGLAIGLVVFAAIIPVAPATGASINPARTFGPMLVQQLAGGAVEWAQLPVYLLAELSVATYASGAPVTYRATAAAFQGLPALTTNSALSTRWGAPDFVDEFSGTALGASWSHRGQDYNATGLRR